MKLVLGSLAHPDFESLAHPTKWSHIRTLILSHSRALTTESEYPSMKTAGVSSRPQAGALLTRLSFSAHKCHFSGLISKKGSCLGLPYESEHAKIQRTPKDLCANVSSTSNGFHTAKACKCFQHTKWISHSKSKCLDVWKWLDLQESISKQSFGV